MGIIVANGSAEIAVSNKIAIYTLGSGAKVYYRTLEFGETPPRWVYQQEITANTETVLTPGSSYDTVRVDSGLVEPTYYETGSDPSVNVADATNAVPDEVTRVCDKSSSIVTLTAASDALTLAEHAERLLVVNKADGSALTLPAATGTGNKYTVLIGTTISSNSTTIKAASASDSFFGLAFGVDTDAEGASGYTWNADSGDDTVTMNGTATGGVAGDVWEFVDFATGKWLVEGKITQSGGAEATPFSATVS